MDEVGEGGDGTGAVAVVLGSSGSAQGGLDRRLVGWRNGRDADFGLARSSGLMQQQQ